MIPAVDNKFETFNFIKFKNYDKSHDTLSKTQVNGNYVEINKTNTRIYYLETIKNTHFQISKTFYLNGNIVRKGIGFNGDGFQMGIWYEFDESGKLIKEIDYDKPFKFTFEDILKFCERENITVDKGPILQSTGWHTTISRGLENGKNPYWSIEWLKKPDVLEKITLDGITGKVVSRTERQYINN